MAMESLALNRRRFILIAAAIGLAGVILVFRGTVDLESDPTSALWKTIYIVAGVVDLAVAAFYAKVAFSPSLPITEVGLTIPWFVSRNRRNVLWADLRGAEVGPARALWSNKPVLRLQRTGQLDAEIPKSFVADWDELLRLVGGKVGTIPNRFV